MKKKIIDAIFVFVIIFGAIFLSQLVLGLMFKAIDGNNKYDRIFVPIKNQEDKWLGCIYTDSLDILEHYEIVAIETEE